MISSPVGKKGETFLQCPYIIIVWTLLHSMSKTHKSTRQLFSHANSTIGSFLARGNTIYLPHLALGEMLLHYGMGTNTGIAPAFIIGMVCIA